jgi:hypothetical protein
MQQPVSTDFIDVTSLAGLDLRRTEGRHGRKRRRAERKAKRVITVWNARQAKGRELRFSQTIRADILAGPPWATNPEQSKVSEVYQF